MVNCSMCSSSGSSIYTRLREKSKLTGVNKLRMMKKLGGGIVQGRDQYFLVFLPSYIQEKTHKWNVLKKQKCYSYMGRHGSHVLKTTVHYE